MSSAAVLKAPGQRFRTYYSRETSSSSTLSGPADTEVYWLDGTSRPAMVMEFFTIPAGISTNSATQLSNYPSDSDRLVMLHEAIAKLASLPADHELHIDGETREQATRFLNLVADRGAPPKLFPQDGEALVFTWDIGPRKRMVTIAGNEASGMDIDKKTLLRCDYDLPLDPTARSAWLPHIGAGTLASSASDDDL